MMAHAASVIAYRELAERLFRARAERNVSEAEEADYAVELNACWCQMTAAEQESIEQWVRERN
jgi:hypothetical protein